MGTDEQEYIRPSDSEVMADATTSLGSLLPSLRVYVVLYPTQTSD